MIRKSVLFAFAVMLIAPLWVHAQLLESLSTDSSEVTVGTTTYNLRFPSPIFESAQRHIQEILYYLRTFDSPTQNVFTGMPETYTPATVSNPETKNIYSDIANYAFDVREEDDSTLITNTTDTLTRGCPVFQRNFAVGDQDPEIIEVQRFLNNALDSPIASTGPGSPGEETDYFGSRTFAAVFAYQEVYAESILAPIGLINPTGYWGPATIAHANNLATCSA